MVNLRHDCNGRVAHHETVIIHECCTEFLGFVFFFIFTIFIFNIVFLLFCPASGVVEYIFY